MYEVPELCSRFLVAFLSVAFYIADLRPARPSALDHVSEL